MFAFPIITCIIRLFSFIFIYKYDTPYYYCSINNSINAKKSLKEIYKPDFVEDEYLMT